MITERYNIIGEKKKIMQSSEGMCIFIIEAGIYEKIPKTWKKTFMKITDNRDNLYNRPKSVIQHCCEKHFYNFNDCRSIN